MIAALLCIVVFRVSKRPSSQVPAASSTGPVVGAITGPYMPAGDFDAALPTLPGIGDTALRYRLPHDIA
jgi:hypothetical protein